MDTRSAGYNRVEEDFQVPGTGFELKIQRAYNSRSLYNGIFGYSWCSNLETRLDTLPGNIIRGVECGGGLEIIYYPKKQGLNINTQMNSILTELKKRRKMDKKTCKNWEKNLKQSQTLRNDFLTALKLKGEATPQMKYYANGRSNEYIVFKNNKLHRYLSSGVSQVFDIEGRLSRVYDKFGNYIDFSWRKNKVTVIDNQGQQLNLILDTLTGKVKEAGLENSLLQNTNRMGRGISERWIL